MTASVPTVSVIIPTHNRSAVVERTLRALDAQAYPSRSLEVIVVDNSTDETPAMVERIAATARCRVRLIARAPRLPAVKRNLGLAAATGELVVFLNDDAWADPDLVAEHVRIHRAHAEPIALLGHVRQSPEMPRTPFIDAYEPFAYGEIADRAEQPVGWRYFWSMNLSLPRAEMLGRNLVFHEDWSEIGHEDVELGYRWTRAGRAIIYNPRARAEHYHPHTVASASRLQESIGRGLRDLEQLIPERGLLERYGIFSWRNSPRAIARGLIRQALFNAFTSPLAARWLDLPGTRGALPRWMYWKVLLYYTNRGYQQAPRRSPRPLATRPPVASFGPT